MKKAFTLIELLIVIAIIGILASILFVSIGQSPLQGSRDAKRVSDLQSLAGSFAIFHSDNNRSPTGTELGTNGTCTIGGTCNFLRKYSSSLAHDPLFDDANTKCVTATFATNASATATMSVMPVTGTGGAGRFAYIYTVTSNNQAYNLQACLENATYSSLKSDCDDTSASPACAADPIYDLHS